VEGVCGARKVTLGGVGGTVGKGRIWVAGKCKMNMVKGEAGDQW
jgi:hypothetical protein